MPIPPMKLSKHDEVINFVDRLVIWAKLKSTGAADAESVDLPDLSLWHSRLRDSLDNCKEDSRIKY